MMNENGRARTQGTGVKVVYVSGKVLHDNTILEAVFDPAHETSKLLVQQPNADPIEAVEWVTDAQIYHPVCNDTVRKGALLMPTGLAPDKQDAQDLLGDIEAFIALYVDIEAGFQPIAARYILLTWVYDAFQKLPYLRFVGPWGSGKSRSLDVIHALSYHGLKLGAGATAANMFRSIDKYKCTLILDDADFFDTDLTSTITQVLNGGYARGGCVSRCQTSQDFEPRLFETFGPKVLAARQLYTDDALESRFLSCGTRRSERTDLPFDLPAPYHWEQAVELRNRLLRWRLDNRAAISNDLPVDGLAPYEPRMQEILRPLIRITGDGTLPDAVKAYADQLCDERGAELALGVEGVLAQAVIDMTKGGLSPTVNEVAAAFNSRMPSRPPFSAEKVGHLLKALGIPKKRIGRGVILNASDRDLILLAERYAVYQ